MVTAFYPTSLGEAVTILKEQKDHLIISGGTDIMVVRKQAPAMIFTEEIPELKTITETKEVLHIGAACVYKDLIQDERIPAILKDAMIQIASPAIRNAGTIGGNICNASPAGDTIPVLHVLDAMVVTASVGTESAVKKRKIPIAKFILGIRKIDLQPEEIVEAIEIPKSSYETMTKQEFVKVGARQSEAISKLSFAAVARVRDSRIEEIRIAFGSVGITCFRDKELEEKLKGQSVTEVKADHKEILAAYGEELHPISDQRSTDVYRKKVCLNLLDHFLEEL